MRKGPGFIAAKYSAEALVLSDPRVSDGWDFARAAGDVLSRVNADPRNHFGKHALRRFEK